MNRKIFTAFLLILLLSGCERNKANYAGIGEPADTPEYTLELDPNKSPAAE